MQNNEKLRLSRNVEMQSLVEQGVFLRATTEETYGCQTYGSKFVDTVKREETPQAYMKPRSVVLEYN